MAESKLREVIQGEEWALFHGDATITNANGAASFDGLDKQLTTNVVDLAGASLTGVGNTVKEVDRLIKKIRLQGGQPTHLFTSFGMQSQINQIVAPDARYIIADGTTVTAGIHAVNYQSPAGVMPVVGDFFVNPATPYNYNTAGSSGPEGASTSSIYCLTVPETAVVDLKPIGRTALAVIADSVRFFVNEYSVYAVDILRQAAVRLLSNIRYIGGTLMLETIPRKDALALVARQIPRDYTRIALRTRDEDIVRTTGRPVDAGRNDLRIAQARVTD